MRQFFFILFHDKYYFISLKLRKNISSLYSFKKPVFISDTSLYSDVEILSMCLSSDDLNCAEFMSTIEYSPSNSTNSDQEKTSDEYVVISSSTSIDNIQDDNR
jgi:hypothetical protein